MTRKRNPKANSTRFVKFKVGQVYKAWFPEDDIYTRKVFVVSRIGVEKNEDNKEYPFGCFVFKDGCIAKYYEEQMGIVHLLAEYPTWKEAINGKEFMEE